MIEFINNGKIVNINYDDEQQCYIIKAAKKITLKPKERFAINTQIIVNCTHELDECVVTEFVRDDLEVYFVSDKYSDDNPEKNIELIGFYNGSEPAIITKGENLARISCFQRNLKESVHYIRSTESNNPLIYADNEIKIQSLTDKVYHIEFIEEPNGSKYIKIPLNTNKVERNE